MKKFYLVLALAAGMGLLVTSTSFAQTGHKHHPRHRQAHHAHHAHHRHHVAKH
jgi:hypothetical protein